MLQGRVGHMVPKGLWRTSFQRWSWVGTTPFPSVTGWVAGVAKGGQGHEVRLGSSMEGAWCDGPLRTAMHALLQGPKAEEEEFECKEEEVCCCCGGAGLPLAPAHWKTHQPEKN